MSTQNNHRNSTLELSASQRILVIVTNICDRAQFPDYLLKELCPLLKDADLLRALADNDELRQHLVMTAEAVLVETMDRKLQARQRHQNGNGNRQQRPARSTAKPAKKQASNGTLSLENLVGELDQSDLESNIDTLKAMLDEQPKWRPMMGALFAKDGVVDGVRYLPEGATRELVLGAKKVNQGQKPESEKPFSMKKFLAQLDPDDPEGNVDRAADLVEQNSNWGANVGHILGHNGVWGDTRWFPEDTVRDDIFPPKDEDLSDEEEEDDDSDADPIGTDVVQAIESSRAS